MCMSVYVCVCVHMRICIALTSWHELDLGGCASATKESELSESTCSNVSPVGLNLGTILFDYKDQRPISGARHHVGRAAKNVHAHCMCTYMMA